jgi:hypothetical protein
MGNRLRTSFIVTTAARLDTSAARLWQLLENAGGWPGWWASMARCDTRLRRPAQPASAVIGGFWRVAWGLPLHLNVIAVASGLPEWQTVRLQGDLQGQLTFTVQAARNLVHDRPFAVDLTCRCELMGMLASLSPWRLLLERRIGRLNQTLVRDLGKSLQCRAQVLAHWQGCASRG